MRAAAILGVGNLAGGPEALPDRGIRLSALDLPTDAGGISPPSSIFGAMAPCSHLGDLRAPAAAGVCRAAGSGNDLPIARTFNLAQAAAAWKFFAGGGSKRRTVDLGVITPLGPNAEPKRYLPASRASGWTPRPARIANPAPRWAVEETEAMP